MRWFAARGWAPRRHQLDLLEKARAGRSALLIAPTGAGKTLAGFLPSLVELSQSAGPVRSPTGKLISAGRGIRRSGDTPVSKRQRQRRDPPDILLTTPEQLALLLASADAPYLFGSLKRVILDELHSLVLSKRGDLLALGLARLRSEEHT